MMIDINLKKGPSKALFFLLLLLECCIMGNIASTKNSRGGTWELLLNNSGVVAMHMVLTHRNTVILFDQTSCGPSGYRIRTTKHCPSTDIIGTDEAQLTTCWAHSVEYDIESNTVRPLFLETDTWCSSGTVNSNGTIVQTGGHGEGYRRIRHFQPCNNGRCGWTESTTLLSDKRWYATNHILPENDRVIVIGGLGVFTYEFVPKSSRGEGSFDLPFLRQTNNRKEKGDNLYPFVHLAPDGNLFVFANKDSILFNYRSHRVVKTFPTIPGDGPRNYPGTGSSVMLPLDYADSFQKAEIVVCGGGADGAYRSAKKGDFLEGLSSCGRIVITDENPKWVMEEMPGPRLMSDMIILPTGDILIINGAIYGCAGWQTATNASYSPYLYKPKEIAGKRFSILNSSKIARMYHSSAIILPDGRILVAGSNPQQKYTFSGVDFPTELRMEAFTPYYMGQFLDQSRASNLSIRYGYPAYGVRYGEEFQVWFVLARRPVMMEFHVYAPPFATHSFSMNQRMLKLQCNSMTRDSGGRVRAVLVAPPSPQVAPSGYYLLTVVNGGIPSTSQWVRFVSE